MLVVPLYTLLIAYITFLAIFFIFFITNLLHILLTGTTTFFSLIITFIILALSILTIYATWYYLQDTIWTQTITLIDINWLKSLLANFTSNRQYF
ncbi:MAG TPA: hypothetical protein VLK22_03240 [Candidatus Udaeobacter sp.]|nr:hypothetical protein [Candidatus Udaeobacter sp.]